MGLSRLRLLRRGRTGEVRLARADGQKNFLAEGIFEFLELQRRLALVAEDFEYGWTTFLGHLYAAIFEMDHVHLQRFDLKVPVIATIRAGQRHELSPFGGIGCRSSSSGHQILRAFRSTDAL